MICTVDVGKVDKESKLTLISFKVPDCIALPTERQTAFTLVVDSTQEIRIIIIELDTGLQCCQRR